MLFCFVCVQGQKLSFQSIPSYSQGLILYWCKVKIYISWCIRARTLFMSHCKTTKEQRRNCCKNTFMGNKPNYSYTFNNMLNHQNNNLTRCCAEVKKGFLQNQVYVILFQAATKGQHPVSCGVFRELDVQRPSGCVNSPLLIFMSLHCKYMQINDIELQTVYVALRCCIKTHFYLWKLL